MHPLVAPFAAERFANLEGLSAQLAPPYDVISLDHRQRLLKQSRHNIVGLTLPDGEDDRYDRAASLLEEWRSQGVLVRESEPSVYVLRQEFVTPSGRALVRTGFIGAVSVEPYASGRVKPHEKTHKGPKVDRLALMRSTKAMFEALLMLAPDKQGEVKRALADVTSTTPMTSAVLDDVHLTVWRVTGAAADSIANATSAEPLYIADGHHRFETANTFREEQAGADRTLALIVPLGDPGLVALPTHRLITSAQAVPADTIMGLVGDSFDVVSLDPGEDVEKTLESGEEHETRCVICLPDGNFLLTLRQDADLAAISHEASVRGLDVARVDHLAVHPLTEAVGGKVTYSPDAQTVLRNLQRGEISCGVLLRATNVQDVLDVADAGAFMPQKSTYFQPKVPSGLVILSFA